MANFSTFVSSFNQATKGKQFEVFVKWFLENDPVWKSEVDKVWMWDDYPDRWGKDCGIDLVFRDKNNETWAVQAKCYDREYPVTKTDVDSFLSESNRPLIQRRLLIATTDNLGPNARKVCAEQEKPVTLFLFSDFEDSAIDYPESISDLSRAKLKPKPQPTGKYSYQLEPITAVVEGFKTHDKGQLIMACGTGKTFTTLWIKEKLNAETTLILLPSLSLLSQTLKEWTFAMNQPFKSLCVCSDETVSKGASEDQLLESVQDLSFPVTADPNLISKFLNSSGTKVLFSTYQSSPMIAEAQKMKDVPAFDLVIADEAHRCAGKVSSSFTTVLNDDLIRSKKKLFTTATPRTYSANLKKQAEELDFEISGMDDEKVFGTEFYRLSFGNAIERGLLTDYQLVIIGVDEPMIADWIKRRELLQTNDEIVDAKSLAAEIGLIKAIKDYNLKRVLSFHSRVKSAEDFSKELPKVLNLIDDEHKPKGKLATGFVSGKMPTNQRRLKLDQLKELTQGDYAVLSNARCLSEGVDVPALDGIAIIDPKASQIDIVQTVGRAIRLSENKSVGTIILPVFIEDGDNPEASIESTNFKPLWDVVKALRSHDEMLAFELDTLRTDLGKMGKRAKHVSGLSKIIIDTPMSIGVEFSNAIKTHLIEKSSSSWHFWIGLLEKYTNEYGHALVPPKFEYEGVNLGNWVGTVRSNYKKSLLSSAQIDILSKFRGWSFAPDEEAFFEFFNIIKMHIKDVNNIESNSAFNKKKVTNWISKKRAEFKSNKLALHKIDLLNSLKECSGWTWDNQGQYKDLWMKHFIYIKENNLWMKPYDYKDLEKDSFNVGSWLSEVRQNKKNNTLDQQRVCLFEQLVGWHWNDDDKKILELENFYKEFGHRRVTRIYSEALYGWIVRIRGQYKDGVLPNDMVSYFNNLDGWYWDVFKELWIENCERYKRLDKLDPIEKKKAEKWAEHQKSAYKKGKIEDSEKIKTLKSLGIIK